MPEDFAAAETYQDQPLLSTIPWPAAYLQGELAVFPEDFAAAETRVRPSGMREVAVEVPRVRWEDIGGLRSVKER